jgi:hypothetical protein
VKKKPTCQKLETAEISFLNYVNICTGLDKIMNYDISKELGVYSVTNSIRKETRLASTCGKNGSKVSAKDPLV